MSPSRRFSPRTGSLSASRNILGPPIPRRPLLRAYFADVHTAHKFYSAILSVLSQCPHPISCLNVLTMRSSFLTLKNTWERHTEVPGGGVERRLIELATSAKGWRRGGWWLAHPARISSSWLPTQILEKRRLELRRRQKRSRQTAYRSR